MNNVLDLRNNNDKEEANNQPELINSEPLNSQPSFFKKTFSFVWEVAKIVVISLIIIVPIRVYVVQPFIVEGASMQPNFEDGQYLIIDEISYRFNSPQRGDVAIFHPPTDSKTYYIKRVIGLPGETVELREGNIYIYNDEYPEGFRLNESNYLIKSRITQIGKTSLKDNEYYLVGDNRDNSLDSRRFGPVKIDNIKGKVFVRAFPFDDFGVFERPEYNILSSTN